MMTPASIYRAEWVDYRGPPVEGEELFVWTANNEDPGKRVLSLIRREDRYFVVVTAGNGDVKQTWEVIQ